MVSEGQAISDVNFSLIPGGVITGRLTDEDSGEPLSGKGVGAYEQTDSQWTPWEWFAKTDDQGRYTFRVPPGQEVVYVQGTAPLKRNVEIKEGGSVVMDFKVPGQAPAKMAEVLIHVAGPDGQPVAGAEVYTLPTVVAKLKFPIWSDAQGIAHCRFRPSDLPLLVRARHGQDAALAAVLAAEAQEALITLEKNALGRISGRVTDPDGKPAAGIAVQVEEDHAGRLIMHSSLRTGPDGELEIHDLWPGVSYSLDVFVPTSMYGRVLAKDIVLNPGESRLLPHLILPPASK